MIKKEDVQKMNALPILSVATWLGLSPDHTNRVKCLFHDDKHPSMHLSKKHNAFKCYSCDASGDNIKLVMTKRGLTFKEACRWLADNFNLILEEEQRRAQQPATWCASTTEKTFDAARYEPFFRCPALSPRAMQFLFDERKLNAAVVRWCRLTSWRDKQGTEWLQFPYYDMEGGLIGVQNRNLSGTSGPRFRFVRGSNCSLYNLPVLKLLKPGEELWITEGPSDCWAMLSAGRKAIAVASATTLVPQQLAPLAGRTVHMYPDQDAAGEHLYRALLQAANEIGFVLMRHQLPAGYKDFAQYYMALATGITRN